MLKRLCLCAIFLFMAGCASNSVQHRDRDYYTRFYGSRYSQPMRVFSVSPWFDYIGTQEFDDGAKIDSYRNSTLSVDNLLSVVWEKSEWVVHRLYLHSTSQIKMNLIFSRCDYDFYVGESHDGKKVLYYLTAGGARSEWNSDGYLNVHIQYFEEYTGAKTLENFMEQKNGIHDNEVKAFILRAERAYYAVNELGILKGANR